MLKQKANMSIIKKNGLNIICENFNTIDIKTSTILYCNLFQNKTGDYLIKVTSSLLTLEKNSYCETSFMAA